MMKSVIGKTFLGLASLLGASHIAMAADLPTKAAPVIPAIAPFFVFQDTTVSYRIETSATDPGSAVHFVKNIANLTHVDAFQYGTNFFSIDFLSSTNADPTAPVLQNAFAPYNFNGHASTEFYGIYRGTLSGNALTHSKTFAFSPLFIKDVSIEYGANGEFQNTEFAPNQRLLVGGINIAFDVPGFLTLGIHASHEWNHNGLNQTGGLLNAVFAPINVGNTDYNTTNGEVNFKVAPEFEITYLQPLTFTGLPLSLSGFGNVTMPKGKDGFNNNTRTEILTAERLTLDLGQVAFNKPKLLDVFVGYKYWMNKFGNNASCSGVCANSFTPGSYESQVFGGLALHVF